MDATDDPIPLFPSVRPLHSFVLNDIATFLDNSARRLISYLIWFFSLFFPSREYWKQYTDKERWRLQFTNRRIIVFLLTVVWMVVLWTGVLYKCIYESVTDFISYFTNISFAYQAVYYLFYFLSFFGDPRKRSLEFFVLFGFWWNMFAQVAIVFVLVFGVFLDAPGLLIDETKTGGGDFDDGVVLVVDRLYHVLPLTVALVMIFLTWIDISDILILMFATVYCLPQQYKGYIHCQHERCAFRINTFHAWIYIIFNYILAFVPLLLYWNIVDIRDVYNLSDFPDYAAFLLMIAINAFAVVLPLVFMFKSTIPNREVPDELVAIDSTRKVVVVPDGIPLPS